ncbi:N-acetylmuramoyl-L-alanine amidase [Halobacillus sp. A1]|uniref:N-acetylmuramoyl-L-alanine amidase n=1 Tax=Halobacillus sp. A1 TaxID=2880262 RepID=UPI0020A69611|nr:N-acetylmuramoyl-L-alanine amidase [Halobacillus sp. A1]MCP3031455.1 N-acetylmuramoyl-L-alanine amidase [Halobacillus sp. A1]
MKRFFILLFGVIVLIGGFLQSQSTVSANSIEGVPSKYKEQINYLIDEEIIFGYDDNTFKPKNHVTRQEAAAMIGRALDLNNTKRNTVFDDVDASHYGSGYIASSVDKGIINGYPNGTFQPNNTITRGEMAVLISRAFPLSGSQDVSFTDVSESNFFYTYINDIASANVTMGYPDGTFQPNREISREEFSLLVARSMNPDFRSQQVKDDNKEKQEDLKVIDEKVVTADSLNVRSGPGTSNGVVGTLSTASAVSVYKKEGNWAYVTKGNVEGWVSMSYLIDKPRSSHVIALDPGHGGNDPGASANGLVEKEVVLDVGEIAEEYLEDAGLDVFMTRTRDIYHTLDNRVKLATSNKADAFVSIHANAAASESAKGVETFYSSAGLSNRAYSSLKLSQFINERLVKEMDMTNRGVKEAGYRVIKATSLPSALTEIGFLTNKGDADKLKQTQYREAAARAISLGVVDYYNWEENN